MSAAEAQAAWGRLRFVPRVLNDVSTVEVSTTLLGAPVSSPFALAPTTLQRAAHPDGELAMAAAATRTGTLLVVSSNAGTPFEAIGGTGATWWLQMYVTAERALTEPVVDRAVVAGARAVVLTVDTPVVGSKRAGDRSVWDAVDPSWLRVNFPERDRGSAKARDLGPRDIGWLAERAQVPVVVKGVLHPEDARRCIDAGAAAVWVSNHGGRQLDRSLTTAEALPGVADSVHGDVEVYVDGGVRRGSDALAAGALGARAVLLGRPALYALAHDGADGVARLLEELRSELVEALRLAGYGAFEALPRTLVLP